MMWGWGMARDDDNGWSAVVRHNDRAVTVRRINEKMGRSYPLLCDELITGKWTERVQVDAEALLADEGLDPASLDLGLPLLHPDRVIGIGLNYPHHAADLGEKVPEEAATFLKPSNTWVPSQFCMTLPQTSSRVTAEGEVAIVLHSPARNATRRSAADLVWGALTVLDLTAEDVLRRNPRFLTRAKGYDGFLVLSHWMVPWDWAAYSHSRRISTTRNGLAGPSNETGRMTYGYGELVRLVTADTTVGALTIISTGTPGAVAVEAGDKISAEVEGLFGVEFRAR